MDYLKWLKCSPAYHHPKTLARNNAGSVVSSVAIHEPDAMVRSSTLSGNSTAHMGMSVAKVTGKVNDQEILRDFSVYVRVG